MNLVKYCRLLPLMRAIAPVMRQPYSDKSGKFREFKDDDAMTILDVEEEKSKLNESILQEMRENDQILQRKVERGTQGVYDIQMLIELLHELKAKDIFTVKLPEELNYVNYLVIASARSRRQVIGLAEAVRKGFKERRHPHDRVPRIEGEKSDWVALDLGNIALHIMQPSMRNLYDLESLWAVGSKFDTLSRSSEDDRILELLKKHSITLDDIQPLTTS